MSRLLVSLALLLSGCPMPAPPDFSSPSALGPVAVGDHLVVGDADSHALVVLDLDHGKLVASRRLALEGPPSLVVAVPGSPAALVLSREDRTLEIVSSDDGDRRTLTLGAPFDGLAVTPDGKVAIAYYPPGTADAVFHNENEIALIDLTPAARSPVTRRTLASLGGAPLAIAMSPLVGTRRYAFVLSDEHVAVVALDDASMPERSVPLVSLTTGGARTPTGVDFAADAATSTLWAIVSTAEASSVYALAIVPAATDDGPDFDVRLSQLAGISPGGAAALTALAIDGDPGLFTLTTSPAAGTLTLTDLETATGTTLVIEPGLDRLLLFEGDDGRAMALAWASNDGRSFHVVDLLSMASGASKAFETRRTGDRFVGLLPIPHSSRFIALHPSDDEGVSVIDAGTSRVTGFGRTGVVRDLQLLPDLDRMVLLTSVGADDFVVSVDLATLHPETARVPDGADALAVLPGVETVAAVAYRVGGQVTLWPALTVSEAETLVVPGFLLLDLFQR